MGDDSGSGREAEAQPMPAEVRFLKWLVTGLAAVMGGGMIALVALMWVRLGQPSLPQLPDTIILPEGASADAVTFARDWIVVVTDAGEVLLYDREGRLQDSVQP
ncbi:DUF6476 family protein [Paracoccus albicereus]|nr:DUF6476 family protein [Paracoccus albicereus]